jgi:ABC-type uncharacterized transport system ATPase subunit
MTANLPLSTFHLTSKQAKLSALLGRTAPGKQHYSKPSQDSYPPMAARSGGAGPPFLFPSVANRFFMCLMELGLTKSKVLSFFAGVYRTSASSVTKVIASVGLEPVLDRRVYTLSKGYGRRLLLALGLLSPHELVLMDEPFDGFFARRARSQMSYENRPARADPYFLRSTS